MTGASLLRFCRLVRLVRVVKVFRVKYMKAQSLVACLGLRVCHPKNERDPQTLQELWIL